VMESHSSTADIRRSSFNPGRLTLARERRGLTKQNLAEICGVVRRTVSAWEAGDVELPPITLLADKLNFPESFFYADDPALVAKDSVSFRALKSMTARQVNRVLASSVLAIEFSNWIDRHYASPPTGLPDLSESRNLEPVIAAETVRTMWAVYQAPVKGLLPLLEKKGVRVFSLPVKDREIDAFSFWHSGRPFIFLNTGRTAERMRFDLAHELGHLLLHREVLARRSRNVEQEAQDFASSFLVPADALYGQVIGQLRFDDIFKLKRYWKVSAVAMVQRLWHLGIISEWHYRTWIIELSQRGFRSSEPGGLHPETSRLFQQFFSVAREDGLPSRKIASELHIPAEELEGMVFGLAIAAAPASTPLTETTDESQEYGRLHRVQ
jgi:Zn-dependent peptidase ImmA (M78 family)/transcriptional regulator with XRE-family HTH domain